MRKTPPPVIPLESRLDSHPHASLSSPASVNALEKLKRVLGRNAEHLMPLYRVTDGFESVIRGGEFHLQLWPIEEFTSREQHLVVIGSDSEAADVVVNMAGDPAIVELWCAFGGGRIEPLCPLPEFLGWVLAAPMS